MRIILVDDHELIRSGLKRLMIQQFGAEIVAEAADGRSAVRLAAELAPDVIAMDIDMPELNGIEATRLIKDAENAPKVIALTASTSVQSARRMLEAGADAYIVKTGAFEEFGEAFAAIRQGKVYISPGINGALQAEAANGGNPAKAVFGRLSGREREVLQLLAEGKATKEAAARLNVSVKTVETHRKHLMEKLNLNSIAELTKYAVREGITSG